MTGGEPISSEVRTLIAQHIRSVVELESLLLMQRDPGRDWNAAELGRELRIDEQWALRQMINLAQAGFVVAAPPAVAPSNPSHEQNVPSRYRYAPAMAQLDQAVRRLAADYAERRVSVIELIYTRPAAATDPLQSFVDAFRIRKERHDGG